MHVKPEQVFRPIGVISLDLVGSMPTGEYLLLVIDYYPRYYEAEILISVTASQIISHLEKIFAVHGLPVTIMSDNGPRLRSEEFEHYPVDNVIRLHRKVTPQGHKQMVKWSARTEAYSSDSSEDRVVQVHPRDA